MNTRNCLNAVVATVLALALWTGGACAATAVTSQTSAGYSAAVLFNQANSLARTGKPGLAVLNYERASLLAPTDPDIRANLGHVRESVGLPDVRESWFAHTATMASPNTLYWLGCGGLMLAGLSVLAGRLIPTRRRTLRVSMLAGVSLVVVSLCNAVAIWPTMHEAVVIANATPARIAPVTVGEPVFTLPEADIVTIDAERGDFVLVKTSAGRLGWVPRADIARIVPRSDLPPTTSSSPI